MVVNLDFLTVGLTVMRMVEDWAENLVLSMVALLEN